MGVATPARADLEIWASMVGTPVVANSVASGTTKAVATTPLIVGPSISEHYTITGLTAATNSSGSPSLSFETGAAAEVPDT